MSPAAIRLYGPPLAPFVEKVVRVLALKKLPYELFEPSGPGDYRRWSPETGLLPALDLGEERVTDSVRILDLLDERHPEPPLLSSDLKVAASQRQLEEWVGESFYFYWVHWLRERAARGPASAGPAGDPGFLARFGVLRRRTERGGSDAEGLGAEFADRLDDLVGFLGNRPFFYAERISRADITVYAFLRSMQRNELTGGEALLEARPALRELMRRVEQHTGPALG